MGNTFSSHNEEQIAAYCYSKSSFKQLAVDVTYASDQLATLYPNPFHNNTMRFSIHCKLRPSLMNWFWSFRSSTFITVEFVTCEDPATSLLQSWIAGISTTAAAADENKSEAKRVGQTRVLTPQEFYRLYAYMIAHRSEMEVTRKRASRKAKLLPPSKSDSNPSPSTPVTLPGYTLLNPATLFELPSPSLIHHPMFTRKPSSSLASSDPSSITRSKTQQTQPGVSEEPWVVISRQQKKTQQQEAAPAAAAAAKDDEERKNLPRIPATSSSSSSSSSTSSSSSMDSSSSDKPCSGQPQTGGQTSTATAGSETRVATATTISGSSDTTHSKPVDTTTSSEEPVPLSRPSSADSDQLPSATTTGTTTLQRQTSSLELCCVCVDNKVEVVLPCGHDFCQICIESWRARNPTCPLCRAEQDPDTEECWTLTSSSDLQTALLATSHWPYTEFLATKPILAPPPPTTTTTTTAAAAGNAVKST